MIAPWKSLWHPEEQFQFQPFEGCPHKHDTIHPFFFSFFLKFFFFLFGCCAVAISMYSYIVGPSFLLVCQLLPVLGVESVLSDANILAHDASWQFSLIMRRHRVGKRQKARVEKAFGIRTVARVCTMAELHLGRPGCLLWNTIEKCLKD